MNTWQRVVSRGAVAILAFDALASVASRALDFPYANAIYGSMLIYLAVGYLAARATDSVGRAALAAGIVGVVEATLGWWMSWLIGPGVLPNSPSTLAMVLSVLLTVVIVVITASAIGALAGVVGRKRLASDRSAP